MQIQKNLLTRKDFEKEISAVARQMATLSWENKTIYGHWLSQTYYLVRHTTSLLSLSAARLGPSNRDQQYEYFQHLKEELNHDLIALEDLKNLGFSVTDFPELPEISALYQAQYYYIEHEIPVSHLGYALCLEGLAASPVVEKIYSTLKTHHGKKATAFLNLHVEVDKDHFSNLFSKMEGLDEKSQRGIIKNFSQSCRLYSVMLSVIANEKFGPSELRKVA